jgi:hypothetical protein
MDILQDVNERCWLGVGGSYADLVMRLIPVYFGLWFRCFISFRWYSIKTLQNCIKLMSPPELFLLKEIPFWEHAISSGCTVGGRAIRISVDIYSFPEDDDDRQNKLHTNVHSKQCDTDRP